MVYTMAKTIYPNISTTNSKLGENIASVNLPAKITCNPDAPCVREGGCYACKGNWLYKNVQKSLMENLKAYKENPKRYFEVIDIKLQLVPYRFFRWHSSGDIVDETYLKGMVDIAKKHKGTKFLCFTKKFDIVNSYLDKHRLPKNLVIVFSSWKDFHCDNPHNLPCTYVEFKKDNGYIPENTITCEDKCEKCTLNGGGCWSLKKGQAVRFKKH